MEALLAELEELRPLAQQQAHYNLNPNPNPNPDSSPNSSPNPNPNPNPNPTPKQAEICARQEAQAAQNAFWSEGNAERGAVHAARVADLEGE
eukprot:scaffold100186_cov42-Phaeocystis_antarctica.AAC.1